MRKLLLIAVTFILGIAVNCCDDNGPNIYPTPLRVISTFPADDADSVAVDVVVSATFSESVDPGTVTGASFQLEGYGATVSTTVSASGRTATCTPLHDLDFHTTYTATLTTDIMDIAGNAMATANSWTFTIVDSTEDTSLQVISACPLDAETDIPIDVALVVTFSEDIDLTTVSEASFMLNGGAISGSVTSCGRTVMFVPRADLDYSTDLTATLTTDIKDLDGRAMERPYSWAFSTQADHTPPEIESTYPKDQDIDIPAGSQITATFSEEVDPNSITTETFTLNCGDVSGTVTCDGWTATFTPSSALEIGAVYVATLDAGITDLSSNASDCLYVWSFKTSGTGLSPGVLYETSPVVRFNDDYAGRNPTISFTITDGLSGVDWDKVFVDIAAINQGGNVFFLGTFFPGQVQYYRDDSLVTITTSYELADKCALIAVVYDGTKNEGCPTSPGDPISSLCEFYSCYPPNHGVSDSSGNATQPALHLWRVDYDGPIIRSIYECGPRPHQILWDCCPVLTWITDDDSGVDPQSVEVYEDGVISDNWEYDPDTGLLSGCPDSWGSEILIVAYDMVGNRTES